MKKIYPLTLLIGSLAIVFTIILGTKQASGARNDPSIGVVDQYSTEHASPPWMDFSWHYRRPIAITSSTTISTAYQVLISLDNVNFPSFNLTNQDGSDLRITSSDGITQAYYYWVESWDRSAQRGYIWVRLPNIPIGVTTLYLYYNNPSATSTSNGVMTFEAFDDNWTQFASSKLNNIDNYQSIPLSKNIDSLFTWFNRGTPEITEPGILSLEDGEGILSTTPYKYKAMGFRANYGLGTGREWGGFIVGDGGPRVIIRDLKTDVDDLYLINSNDEPITSTIILEGSSDWHGAYHAYEILWKSGQSTGIIDHTSSSATSIEQVPNSSLPITFYSYSGSNAVLKLDWVYVRNYQDPEPTATVGFEQGLVDLVIQVEDSPDPLQKGAELTYLLTVSNNSNIVVPGVVVTNTLPGNVIFIKTIPPDCSQLAGVVVCNMNTIAANSTDTVSIVVSPYLDGEITNAVYVDSLGFETDWNNNTNQTSTLVDSVAPNVNWVKPVISGQKYTTHGGVVNLEASAADNDQVAWVDFWYWNHLTNPGVQVPIGRVFSYPYQLEFNSGVLVPNEEYQVFAQAGDRAGNITDIYTPPFPRIFLTRISENYIYLPLTIK